MDQSLIPLMWVFGFFVLFLVSNHLNARARERQEERIHKERMMAMEKGLPLPELPPLPPESDPATALNPKWPLAAGVVLLLFGIGTLTATIISTTEIQPYWTLGLVPVFVGVGSILYYYLTTPGSR